MVGSRCIPYRWWPSDDGDRYGLDDEFAGRGAGTPRCPRGPADLLFRARRDLPGQDGHLERRVLREVVERAHLPDDLPAAGRSVRGGLRVLACIYQYLGVGGFVEGQRDLWVGYYGGGNGRATG